MFAMHRSRLSALIPILAIHGLLAGSVLACQDQAGHAGHAQAGDKPAAPVAQPSDKPWPGDPYMLATDPVSGASLGPIEKQVIVDDDGRELRFATAENAAAFKAAPDKYLPALDAAMTKQQLPFYPLDTCMVSGDKLGGDMGEPINFIYKNRLVRFCCADCKPRFLADPAKFIADLDKAVIAKQAPTYALKTCPVSGDALGGDMGAPIDAVYGNRLVRFCCKDCPKDFRKDPLKYLGQLPSAGAAEKAPPASPGKDEHGYGGH